MMYRTSGGPRRQAREAAPAALRPPGRMPPAREAVTMSGNPFEVADDSPVYVISVAAELSGLHPQTLRAYDRLGLVSPGRSSGRGRRYSLRDVLLLREVQRLSQEVGVNLSGIKQILELGAELDRTRRLLAPVRNLRGDAVPAGPARQQEAPPAASNAPASSTPASSAPFEESS